MGQLRTVTITAFGYEHHLTDSWTDEEVEMITDAPILYLLSGSDDAITTVDHSGKLPMDTVILTTDAGEYIAFGWEEMSEESLRYIKETADVAVEMEERVPVTVTITAFGYEHQFTGCWTDEEIEMIKDAPILYLLSGSEDAIDSILGELPMDTVILQTDAGEWIAFGWEEIGEESMWYIEKIANIAVEMEERV